MLVRVWQYDVTPGHEAEFERLYNASGAWAQLFRRSAGCGALTSAEVDVLG